MKSRLLSDLKDSFGDSLGSSDINFDPLAPTGHNFGSPPPHSTPASPSSSASMPIAPILPAESVQAMVAVSASGSGGPGSVVAETSTGGFTINLIFDAAAMAAPASFRTGIEQAAAILSETITDKVTVNIDIDYSGTGGGAFAGPTTGQFVPYSTVRADLIANAAPGDTSFNALPTGSKIQGQSQVAVWNAQLKLFGLLSPTNSAADGSASFATDINPNLLVGVALHELTHAIGRVPFGQPDGPQPDIFDFYRFTSPGTFLFTDNIPSSSAYFSLDGGNTKLADLGVSSDPSDFLNSGVQGFNDPFNEFYSGSTLQSLTSVDLKMLDALGFNFTPLGLTGNTVEALQGGGKVSLLSQPAAVNDTGSTTLSSATIKIADGSSNPVSGDELFINGLQSGTVDNGLVSVSWNDAGKTLTLSGTASTLVYAGLLNEITFQDTGTDASSGSHPVRTVTWTINDGTNSFSAISQITIDRAPVASNSTATDAAGGTITAVAASGVLSNASDLDNDQLTVTAVSDAAHGAGAIGSSLAGAYGHLTLNADGSYSYVADNGAAISSAATGGHLQDVFSYTVSDGNGGTATASLAVTLDRAPVVTASNSTVAAGTSVAASSLFSATDPDGNPITTYAFKDTGSGHFVLNGTVEPNNQELDFAAAQLSQLTYQGVLGSVDTVQVRVNDGTLWSNWTSFTVTPGQVIQTDGTTNLVQAGNNYFLDPVGGGTGPELKYNGAAVTAGEFGAWTPYGAVQVAGGYDVAWKNPGANQYTVWQTDSSGNLVSFLVAAVPGSNATLESIETTFNQDLNGDNIIGLPPPTVIQTDGTTSLVTTGGNYFLNTVGSSSLGPELKLGGAAVTAGEFGTWIPYGAVQVAGGYDVAWKNPGANQYTVWNTDSSGNLVSFLVAAVPGDNATLESIETTFNQDLNGDNIVGPPPPTVIQTDGTTSLVTTGGNYFLNTVGSSGLGPELKYNGAAVTVGEFGTWTPYGAVQVAGGYDVAWKNPGANQYTVWQTDSSGNLVSLLVAAVPANNAALESIETTFNQDLNGDNTIGLPPPTVIQTDGTTSLVTTGGNYFLDVAGSNTLGPELKYNGAAVTAGEFGTWIPYGAVQVSGGGYDVAWKNPGANQYTVWQTDSSGNLVSFLVAAVPGNNTTLESIETTFNQDLNGDTIIGVPPATQPAAQTAAANSQTAVNSLSDNFQFASGSEPVLQHSMVGTPAPNSAVAIAGHDVFVFAPNFGQVSIANFTPATDRIDFSKTVFANLQSVLAATHDDPSGNAVITDTAHDTITLKQVTTAQLLAHQGDFHFI